MLSSVSAQWKLTLLEHNGVSTGFIHSDVDTCLMRDIDSRYLCFPTDCCDHLLHAYNIRDTSAGDSLKDGRNDKQRSSARDSRTKWTWPTQFKYRGIGESYDLVQQA